MITDEYLADLAISWASGKRERVRKMLEAQGKQVEVNDGYWVVRSNGFVCGLQLNCSSVDALPQLCFALIGPMWPFVVGKAFNRAQEIISRKGRINRR